MKHKSDQNHHNHTEVNKTSDSTKISVAFQERLAHVPPEQKVHAIVVLDRSQSNTKETQSSRQNRQERQRTIDKMRELSEKSLDEIDRILTEHKGKRLSDRVNVLGTIPIETSRSGIYALAESPIVKSILEDQKISLV